MRVENSVWGLFLPQFRFLGVQMIAVFRCHCSHATTWVASYVSSSVNSHVWVVRSIRRCVGVCSSFCICISICLFDYLSALQSARLSVSLFVCPPVCCIMCLPFCFHGCLFVGPHVFWFLLPIHVSVPLSVYLPADAPAHPLSEDASLDRLPP